MGYSGDYISDTDVDNWSIGSGDDEYKAVIDKVEQLIDKVCKTHFGSKSFDIKLNGNGKNRLFIPLQDDIIGVDHVYISCIELPPSWYDHDKSSIYLAPCQSGYGESGFPWAELHYRLGEAADEGIFPRGYNNVWVQGRHGEGELPEAIKQAATILAKWENDPTLYTYFGLKKSERIGDYSYTSVTTDEADVLTGVMEADMFLRLYVKRKPMVMAP